MNYFLLPQAKGIYYSKEGKGSRSVGVTTQQALVEREKIRFKPTQKQDGYESNKNITRGRKEEDEMMR